MSEKTFSPDWISPPGETIAVALEERGLSHEDFARAIQSTPRNLELLLEGSVSLTKELAHLLAEVLGASANFWLRRETRYRKDLTRLVQEGNHAVDQNWLEDLPVKEMVALGWIKAKPEPTALATSALRFFGVPNLESWKALYQDAINPAAFRTSSTFDSQPGAIAAWLRQGELLASEIACDQWNPEQFKNCLQEIRCLTREKDPKIFLPELTRLCAQCGVAVVALRAPKKCRASGAVRFISSNRPMLMLSFRYLSDDHLWFTFFHEAAHLLLHADKCFFLEGDERLTSKEEEEANTFAANILIPPEFQPELHRLRAKGIPVMRFAKKVGISPGIIVGQLQHLKQIGYDQLTNLKRRYEWDNT